MSLLDTHIQQFLPQDTHVGALKISQIHDSLINDGQHFIVNYSKQVATAGTLTLVLTTPAAPTRIHASFYVEADYNGSWTINEGSSTSVGSALSVTNNYRGTTGTCGCTVFGDPTITTNGTVLETHVLTQYVTPPKQGGDTGQPTKYVLAQSTQYMIKFTSSAVSTIRSVIDVPLYYVTE